ncbi:MAG: hypothetical protein COT18_03650 [Elusimicrobia bacterium CG08_land_8_20_14_0_20_59_10]|nr:MAG: hypothetical protein COT18_03650 [Elusimicrobia bacterium CG08_land_8_20_14_0_20_59_10]
MARLYELLPGNYLRARRPVPACRRPAAFYAANPVQYRRFCLTNMLQLTVKSPLSFQWNSQPPQWWLRDIKADQRAALMREFPFIIGRAGNCHLVLPDSPELRNSTSRWHCYLTQKAGRYFIADGSFEIVPETGEKNPASAARSITAGG